MRSQRYNTPILAGLASAATDTAFDILLDNTHYRFAFGGLKNELGLEEGVFLLSSLARLGFVNLISPLKFIVIHGISAQIVRDAACDIDSSYIYVFKRCIRHLEIAKEGAETWTREREMGTLLTHIYLAST